MIDRGSVQHAADELLATAMLDDGWKESLQLLADATEAGGASLVRLQAGRHVAHVSSTDWAESETALATGGVPPSGLRYYPEAAYGAGFCVDHDVWTDDEMRRDPYFQEFLRPRGVFFHAKLRLLSESDDRITLTLKRRLGRGCYEPSEVAVLDSIVPQLRASFRVTRSVLDAEATGMARALHRRGDPVFGLDMFGRVLRSYGTDDLEPLGIVARERRLFAADRRMQATLDRAISGAVGPQQQPGFVAVTNQCGEHNLLHVLPVTGRARDVFLVTAAMVVVIAPHRPSARLSPELIRQVFGLTGREAQIAALLAEGLALAAIARRLHLGLGTVRNHLKSIFGKTATQRQGELVALLGALGR